MKSDENCCIIGKIFILIIAFVQIPKFILKGCVLINLYDFFNSLDITLEKNLKSYNDSFINSFVNELKNYLAVSDCVRHLQEFSPDSLFTLDRFEGNFAVCENRATGEMIDIPRSLIDSTAKDGDILRFDGEKLHIDVLETEKEQEIIKELFENNSDFKSLK